MAWWRGGRAFRPENRGAVGGPTTHSACHCWPVRRETPHPGVFQGDDGEFYIVWGVMAYSVARLNTDMVSLAEPPRSLSILHPIGPFGRGQVNDKPYLHKANGVYYLS